MAAGLAIDLDAGHDLGRGIQLLGNLERGLDQRVDDDATWKWLVGVGENLPMRAEPVGQIGEVWGQCKALGQAIARLNHGLRGCKAASRQQRSPQSRLAGKGGQRRSGHATVQRADAGRAGRRYAGRHACRPEVELHQARCRQSRTNATRDACLRPGDIAAGRRHRNCLGEAAHCLDAENEGRKRLAPVDLLHFGDCEHGGLTGPLGCTIASAWVSSNVLMEDESVLMNAAVRASVR